MYLLFDDLGRMIAEAALMNDLAPDERDALAETIEDWHARLSEYGVEDAFPVAIRALQDGWDDPQLQAAVQGRSRKWPPPRRDDDHAERALAHVRLRVLEACGRADEYLNLSRAFRAHAGHAAMLAKQGRLDDAKVMPASISGRRPRRISSRGYSATDLADAATGMAALARSLGDYGGAMNNSKLV